MTVHSLKMRPLAGLGSPPVFVVSGLSVGLAAGSAVVSGGDVASLISVAVRETATESALEMTREIRH